MIISLSVISFLNELQLICLYTSCNISTSKNIQKYDQNMNTRNRHMFIHIYRNPKTLEIVSGTKLFITLLSLRFFDMRRERDTISYYADCLYIVSSRFTDSTNARHIS